MLHLQITGKGRSVFTSETIVEDRIFLCENLIILSPKDTRLARTTHLNDYLFDFPGENIHRCTRSAIALGLASLINHSDTPNAAWETDAISQTIYFYALRQIEIGEEITHNYHWPKRRLHEFT